MAKYDIRVTPRDQRLHEIALRVREAERNKEVRQEFKFRAGKAALPLIVLPIDKLIYRLENYRTRDQQLTLVADGRVEFGFFSQERKEDASVQQAQHALLLEQARQGSGATIKAIYDELERVKQQTDHLIITDDGVVVNGNRRLAAMRELLADESQTFGSFAHVLCLVLPSSATPAEILELEIGLQMQPDTKLPYSWTAIGRAAKDLRTSGTTPDQIAMLMNRSVQDVQRAITMFEVADIYLRDWLGKPNAYSQLENTEQAFAQVASRNWERDDQPAIRETTRMFDFFVIERRADLIDRAYEVINNIEHNPISFLEQVALEWDVQLPDLAAQDGDLEITFDDVQAPAKDYSRLVDILRAARSERQDAERRVASIAQISEIVSEQNKQLGKAALNFAKKADKALSAVDLRTAEAATIGELHSVLSACQERCSELIGEIDSRRLR